MSMCDIAKRLYRIGEIQRVWLPILAQNPRLGYRSLDLRRDLGLEERMLLRTVRRAGRTRR